MTHEEADLLASRIADELSTRKRAQWVDPETHMQHHQHVAVLIRREEELTELKKKILYSACMWAIPLIFAFVLSSFWQSIVKIFRGALR